jgi:hypothetical protein
MSVLGSVYKGKRLIERGKDVSTTCTVGCACTAVVIIFRKKVATPLHEKPPAGIKEKDKAGNGVRHVAATSQCGVNQKIGS